VAEHHQRRLTGLRLASGGGSNSGSGCFGSSRSEGSDAGAALADLCLGRVPGLTGGGKGLAQCGNGVGSGASCLAAAAAAAAAAGGDAGTAPADPLPLLRPALPRRRPAPLATLARCDFDSVWSCSGSGSSIDAADSSSGASSEAGAGPGSAASVLSCPSVISSLAAARAAGGSHASGGCGGSSNAVTAASTPSWGGSRRNSRSTTNGDDVPSSPFALYCSQEYWDEEMVIVANY